MVQIFGTVERSFTEEDSQFTTFRIPAFSKAIARQRAKANARIKGLSNFTLSNVEEAGSGDIPGQTLYDVVVESDR